MFRHRMKLVSMLALAFFLVAGSTALAHHRGDDDDVEYGAKARFLPSNGKIYSWVKKLVKFGKRNHVFPGVRQAGTEADKKATEWLARMLEKLRLDDVHREAVPMLGWEPSNYGLTAHGQGGDVVLDAWPIFYSRFIDGGQVTAPMVYVGLGFPSDFAGKDIAGKIVVADLISPVVPPLLYDNLKAEALETYDPGNTFEPGGGHPYWAFVNQFAYSLAAAHGAAAFIGINVNKADKSRYYQNAGSIGADPLQGILGPLPGLYVSNATGAVLRPLAAAGAPATVVSEGVTPDTETYNVHGLLPGSSAKVIQLSSHSDGGAVNDATGAASILGLAHYYSHTKLGKPVKTLRFVIVGGHFTAGIGRKAFIEQHSADLLADVVLNMTIEHVGKHYDLVDGKLVDSGLPDPRGLFMSDNSFFATISDAVHRYDLRRTFILPVTSAIAPGTGEGWGWHSDAGLASIWMITPVQYMQSTVDTKEKVAVGELRKVVATYTDILDALDPGL